MRNLSHKTDLCIVGGGMSGLCCAIAAARHGIKVVLLQDRPVLGGNASSEIRMWIGGAHGKDNRESGIIEEIFLENFYQNPGLKYPIWDSVLYEKAKARRDEMTYAVHNTDELKEVTESKNGFIKMMWCGDEACEKAVKDTYGVGSRCIPFEQENLGDVCPICGRPAKHMVMWGKAY